MKKVKTLRQQIVLIVFMAALVPMTLFAVVSQIRLRSFMKQSMEHQIQSNLEKSDQCLDMTLDRYDSILYDLSTDDEIAELVRKINESPQGLDANHLELRRKFSHICNRNEGVIGITMQADNGEIVFYDRIASSSDTTTWADCGSDVNTEEGAVFLAGCEPIENGGDMTYYFQIARRVIDYQDIHRRLGTIIISINATVLQEAVALEEEASTLLCAQSQVVSSPNIDEIGKTFYYKDSADRKLTSKVNHQSGWTIYNLQSMKEFNQTIWEQVIFWSIIAIAAILVLVLIVYYYARPALETLGYVVKAMDGVAHGDLDQRVVCNDTQAKEIQRINHGFNDMVEQINTLIEQVKHAVLDQKNAEIFALEAQIDPHFLYNTLDTINWKAIENDQYDISEMLGALADILRYTVKNAGEPTRIEQELYWLDKYILLQSAKLGRELNIIVKVPRELYCYKIHKLLLQAFIENAIRHGLYHKEGECTLRIEMREANDQIHITIEDNGVGMEPKQVRRLNEPIEAGSSEKSAQHMGVENVRKRLQLYYGEDANIYYESKSGEYTKVHLFIPKCGGEL